MAKIVVLFTLVLMVLVSLGVPVEASPSVFGEFMIRHEGSQCLTYIKSNRPAVIEISSSHPADPIKWVENPNSQVSKTTLQTRESYGYTKAAIAVEGYTLISFEEGTKMGFYFRWLGSAEAVHIAVKCYADAVELELTLANGTITRTVSQGEKLDFSFFLGPND